MASATATARSEPKRPRRWWALPGSRLGRLIVGLNLLGLAILVGGALILNELRRGLVEARVDSLTTQGELIANVIDRAATVGEPVPALEAFRASDILQQLFIPRGQRARLFDAQGRLIADSYVVADRVEWRLLPPARRADDRGMRLTLQDTDAKPGALEKAHEDLAREVRTALRGGHVAGMRRAENGERVVSVSIPIQHVKAVLGVLTVEAGDVDAIVRAERAALAPFILIAVAAILLSSILLTRLVAQPVLRLAEAADRVRLSRARAITLPDLARRDDELGDLTRALEGMTTALSERMDAIEAFAADVAHEIRNPLTSIRSAVETLDIVSDPKARARLIGVLKQDVQRLDRLVTDIANASRLDAELSRDDPRVFDLARLLQDIVSTYDLAEGSTRVPVRLTLNALDPVRISGREGPISQIFRNLIDNARSFSPPGSDVRVSLARERGFAVITVEDDGPGVPPENLESIFQRFYTSRPKGTAFGGNSGLGLSIARQIVEAHRGEVHAENRPGAGEGPAIAGARFVVRLPTATP